MFEIEMQAPTPEFKRAWSAAGLHLQTKAQGALKSWLKVNLDPPFLEHLSFRLGNQLFFMRIEDVTGRMDVPGSREGLQQVAEGCKGVACILPMQFSKGEWTPDLPGWGLVDPTTGHAIEPPGRISDERIEMTDWELHDFAVQIVRDALVKDGKELISWHSNPHVDPSIWFVGATGPEWVIVRAARYPTKDAPLPSNWEDVARECARQSALGNFASVCVASSDDAFDPSGQIPATPLWRGHGMVVRFEGVKRLGSL